MRQLPHSEPAEVAVLGAILTTGDASDAAELTVEDFHVPGHQTLWATIREIAAAGRPIDVVTVHDALRACDKAREVGDLVGLGRMTDQAVGHVSLVRRHAELLRKLARERRVIQAAQEIVDRGVLKELPMGMEGGRHVEAGDFVDWAEAAMLRATTRSGASRLKGPKALAKVFFEGLAAAAMGQEPCVSTPWEDLNEYLGGGCKPEQLYVVAGRPSMGKTAAVVNIAMHASIPRSRDMGRDGPLRRMQPVLFFSLEQSDRQLVTRVFAGETPVHSSLLQRGRLTDDESQAVQVAGRRFVQSAFHLDDSPSPTVAEILARARRFRADRTLFTHDDQVGLIVVDHLGLVPPTSGGPKGRTREQEVAEVTKALKGLAKDLHMPVILLSQLNRLVETRTSKRPVLSDLRESGAIEQDADVVLLMYREEYYAEPADVKLKNLEGKAEIIIAKQRDGETGTVHLRFRKSVARFDALERGTR